MRTASVILLLIGFAGTALGQTPGVDLPIRIGALLPAVPEPGGAPFDFAVAEAARLAAGMAADEFGFNAEILGLDFALLTEHAADTEALLEAAGRLIDEEGVFALLGGFGTEQALALSALAEERQIPFLNVGASSDSLRNEACSRFTFHFAPSDAMYLDALVGWFVRAGFRRWFFVHEDDPERESQYRRTTWSIRNRHFGAREVGRIALAPGTSDFGRAINAARRNDAEVILLLLEPEAQLAFLEQYETADLEAQVTGFPDLGAQTRAFFLASRDAALKAGSGFRSTAWEATLDAYGARELNARFLGSFGSPMEYSAWAVLQAVKVLFEAATFGGSLVGEEVVAYLENSAAVFDVYKGIGISFRPWDHQLRQSIYLVDIRPEAEGPQDAVLLVGELPAIYMPRTDPVERLDQIGDAERESECRF